MQFSYEAKDCHQKSLALLSQSLIKDSTTEDVLTMSKKKKKKKQTPF